MMLVQEVEEICHDNMDHHAACHADIDDTDAAAEVVADNVTIAGHHHEILDHTIGNLSRNSLSRTSYVMSEVCYHYIPTNQPVLVTEMVDVRNSLSLEPIIT